MKTLKQLREEYDNEFLTQASPEELVLEEKKVAGIKKAYDVPSPSTMPNLLMFRRVTYRLYPDKQVVALYYSKTVDKYLSIPFGPTGNLNLSEATVYDTLEELDLAEGAKWDAVKGGVRGAIGGGAAGFIAGSVGHIPGSMIGTPVGAAIGAYKGAKKAYNRAKTKESMKEDWQDVNRKDKTDGLSQAAVNAYRRENPGSKLQTAVTEKNPKGKRAARRKSFCSRMGGMKKRLTSAKTARDPDSRINKALRRWNCEEDFKMKLYELRMQQNEGVADVLDAGAEAIVPYYSAGKKLYKGDYKGAATDAAVDTALLATGAVAGKALVGGAKLASKGLGRLASRFGRGASKAKPAPKVKPTPKPSAKPSKLGALGAAADMAKDVATGSSDDVETKTHTFDTVSKSNVRTHTPEVRAMKKTVQENKMSDLRQMIEEGRDTMNIGINGRSVTLNTGMAKRILEVYDSVNSKNKKIVENMLNEDLESFKRLLTFSIRN
jgi:hypothetical protein